MSILADAKLRLRIVGSAFDSEIEDLIDEAKADLVLVGLNTDKVVTTDDLVKRAILTYVKANFGWDNPDAERLHQSYEMIRNHLSLSEEYTEV